MMMRVLILATVLGTASSFIAPAPVLRAHGTSTNLLPRTSTTVSVADDDVPPSPNKPAKSPKGRSKPTTPRKAVSTSPSVDVTPAAKAIVDGRELQTEAAALRAELRKQEAAKAAFAQRDVVELRKQCASMRSQLSALQEEAKAAERASAELLQLEAECAALEGEAAAAVAERASIEARASAASTSAAASLASLNREREQLAELRAIEAADAQQTAAQVTEAELLVREIEAAKARLAKSARATEALEAKLLPLRTEHEAAKRELNAQRRGFQALRDERARFRAALRSASTEADKLAAEAKRAEAEAAQMDAERLTIEAEVAALREEIPALAEQRNASAAGLQAALAAIDELRDTKAAYFAGAAAEEEAETEAAAQPPKTKTKTRRVSPGLPSWALPLGGGQPSEPLSSAEAAFAASSAATDVDARLAIEASRLKAVRDEVSGQAAAVGSFHEAVTEALSQAAARREETERLLRTLAADQEIAAKAMQRSVERALQASEALRADQMRLLERNAAELAALKADAKQVDAVQAAERKQLASLATQVEREARRLEREASRKGSIEADEVKLRKRLEALEAKRASAMAAAKRGGGGATASGLPIPDAGSVLESAAVGLIKFFVPEEVYKQQTAPKQLQAAAEEETEREDRAEPDGAE